jgi:hypothetical protein
MYKGLTPEQQLQCLVDIKEIEHVMAKHAYLMGMGRTQEELKTIWVRQAPDPHFAQNQGYYVGYESLGYYYGKLSEIMQEANLRALAKHFPEIEVTPENYGMGSLVMHPLTTQIVEVAGDGMTAKGMWYSPGQSTSIMADGLPHAKWIWEKYGVDFMKEDGEWRIWHLHVYTDFMTPVGESWVRETSDAPMGVGVNPEVKMPAPDKEESTYETYSVKQVPQDIPKMPEPYYTFSETFSY